MNKTQLIGALCAVLFTFITMSANAALVSRLGGAAAYDDVLDITWTTNANINGVASWDNQVAWADGFSLGGFDDWRLASMSVAAGLPTGTTTSVIDCSSSSQTACEDNELGYMYYYNLGGTGDQTGNHTIGDVTLTDVQSNYWSGTEFNSSDAWRFRYSTGLQGTGNEDGGRYGWAVRAGDSFVPIPAAVWLFGSGLLGLIGMALRKKT